MSTEQAGRLEHGAAPRTPTLRRMLFTTELRFKEQRKKKNNNNNNNKKHFFHSEKKKVVGNLPFSGSENTEKM